MSIAHNAPWSFPKLRRSGMFVRRFMESSNVRGTCIVTMNRVVFSLSSTGGEGWGEEVVVSLQPLGSRKASFCFTHALGS